MADDHLPNADRTRKCSVPACDEWVSWGQAECLPHNWIRVPKRRILPAKPGPDAEWTEQAERVKAMRSIGGRCDVCGGRAQALLDTRQLCRSFHSVRASAAQPSKRPGGQDLPDPSTGQRYVLLKGVRTGSQTRMFLM